MMIHLVDADVAFSAVVVAGWFCSCADLAGFGLLFFVLFLGRRVLLGWGWDLGWMEMGEFWVGLVDCGVVDYQTDCVQAMYANQVILVKVSMEGIDS